MSECRALLILGGGLVGMPCALASRWCNHDREGDFLAKHLD